jgi:hypothetical protein
MANDHSAASHAMGAALDFQSAGSVFWELRVADARFSINIVLRFFLLSVNTA